MTGQDQLAELALELVNIASVSRHEEEITSWIAGRVGRLPAVRTVHSQADAIIFGPPGRPDVIIAGHSDTVPAQDNLPGRLENGQVHGLGSSDMKGSLAVMLCLARELERLRVNLNPLFVIFGREELPLSESVLSGLFDVCPSMLEPALAVVMEPTDNVLQAGCLGNIQASLVFRGVAAHSARPWLGVNAIHEAVRGLRRLVDAEPEDVVLDGLTFREVVGVTEISGGIANNVIPDTVVCGLNFRYSGLRTPAEAETRLKELVGSAGDLKILSNAPSAPVAIDNPLLRRLQTAGNLRIEPKQAWTPVAEFAGRGIAAVNFGPGTPELAHRRDERISVNAMLDSLSILRRFLGAAVEG